MEIFSGLHVIPDGVIDTPEGARLGYAGCRLTNNAGDAWFARDALVRSCINARTECRQDIARRFERMLLATAPLGLLPEDLVDI